MWLCGAGVEDARRCGVQHGVQDAARHAARADRQSSGAVRPFTSSASIALRHSASLPASCRASRASMRAAAAAAARLSIAAARTSVAARWCLFGRYRRGGCDHVRGIFCRFVT